ncbi:MAG: nuclear transport factor 2 family protein [Solirubrobacteraceae bacterium]
MNRTAFLAGAATAVTARALLIRALHAKFAADVTKLNTGDYSSLLNAFADDGVIVFTENDTRWSGEHRGKPAIERFLQEFTRAGLQGEITEVFVGGPPWRMTLLARFDDHADAPDGERIYENRTVLVVRTRWGKIVHQEDFYVDTVRMQEFERRLTALGVAPVG